LKEFGLNLKRKVCFKKSLKKKRKKEKITFPPNPPAAAHLTASPFLFPADADTWAPPVSLSPSPSFLLPHLAAQPTRRYRANPAAPRHFPSFPPHQAGQLRQLTFPVINWSRYPSISTEP
jgi:hypothetical protein